MSEGTTKAVIIGSIFGILGVLIGAIATGLITLYADKQELRLNAAIESFKFDYGEYPTEFLDLKQLVDEMQSLTTLKPTTVRKLANIIREYPDCVNKLSEACRPAFVKHILVMREEMGSGYISPEDIDIILREKYIKAQIAIENLAK